MKILISIITIFIYPLLNIKLNKENKNLLLQITTAQFIK